MSINGLVKEARIEILPFKSVIPKLERLADDTTLQIATHDIGKMVSFVSDVTRRYEFNLVPHLPARLFESQDQVKKTLDILIKNEVKDVFVIGGDEKVPKGPYNDSLTLLHDLADMRYLCRLKNVGTGCYPTGHPFISEETLVRYLKAKNEFVTYLVGNLDFDYNSVLKYTQSLREKGIDKPFIASILGSVRKNNLFSLLKEFSPKKTVSYMRSHPTLLLNLAFGRYSPDKFLKGLAENERNEDNLRGVLFSTFNSIESHVEWMKNYQ